MGYPQIDFLYLNEEIYASGILPWTTFIDIGITFEITTFSDTKGNIILN